MSAMHRSLCFLLFSAILLPATIHAETIAGWSQSEWQIIQSFSIDKLATKPLDPSNRYLHEPGAAILGKQLFFDTNLSKNQSISCSSCHQPDRLFMDSLPLAKGLKEHNRNTPTILNAAYLKWFFWDGRKDSLWAQALTPLEDAREHGLTRIEVVRFIAENPSYREQYETLFPALPADQVMKKWPLHASPVGNVEYLAMWKSMPQEYREAIDQIFANIGKSIAAYVATLESDPSRLDRYISEISTSGSSALLTETELQGLKVFISRKAACTDCHSGPLLTNQGFHNIGTAIPQQDMGRSEVVDAVQWDRFNCLGKYSDASKDECTELRYMNKSRHQFNGAFKTPSLRHVSATGPYMHDGRFNTLPEVIKHYVAVSGSPANHLGKISLSEEEQNQLAAFLHTLGE